MSAIFYVEGPDDEYTYDDDSCLTFRQHFAELHVDDPGHGTLLVVGLRRRGGPPARDRRLSGPDLGRLLDALTATACRSELGQSFAQLPRLGAVSVSEARLLLPQVQRAVLLATAGTNRYEVVQDTDDDPFGSFCVTCGEGEVYATRECRTPRHPDATCERTAWCDRHGHSWFAGRAPAPTAAATA